MNSILFPQSSFDKERLELKEKLKHHFNYVINSSKIPLDKNQLAKWAYKSFFTSFPYPPIKRNDSDFINEIHNIVENELGYNLKAKASLQKTALDDIEKVRWETYVKVFIPYFVKDQIENTPELGNKFELARDAYKFMLDEIPAEVQADPDFDVIVNKVRDDLQEEYGDFLSTEFIIPDAPRTEEAIEPSNDPDDDNEGAQLVNDEGSVVNERFDEPEKDDSLKFNDIYQNTDSTDDIKEEMINEYLDELHEAMRVGDTQKVELIKRKISELQSLASLRLDWAQVISPLETLLLREKDELIQHMDDNGAEWLLQYFKYGDHIEDWVDDYAREELEELEAADSYEMVAIAKKWYKEFIKSQASLKFSVFNNIEGEQNETNIGENAQKEQNTENTQNQTNQEFNQEAPQSTEKTQLDIHYLEPNDIIEAHDHVLIQYGGSPGLFEGGYEKLEAAIGRMQSAFGDQEFFASIFEKAAVLMHSIITTHPFVDGNKRAAYVSAVMFLHYNDFTMDDSEELADIIIRVASDEATYDHLLEWVSKNATHWIDSHAPSFKKLTNLKLDWANLPEEKKEAPDPNIVLRALQEELEDEIASGQPGVSDDQFYDYVYPVQRSQLVSSSLSIGAIIENNPDYEWYYIAERQYEQETLFDLIGVTKEGTIEAIRSSFIESLSEIMGMWNAIGSLKLDWRNIQLYECSFTFAIEAKKLVDRDGEPDDNKERNFVENKIMKPMNKGIARFSQGSLRLQPEYDYDWDSSNLYHASAIFGFSLIGTKQELLNLAKYLIEKSYLVTPNDETDIDDVAEPISG